MPVVAAPKWGIGVVTVPVRVSYPSGTDGASSREILVTTKVLVVHPLWLVAFVCMLGLLAWYVIGHRRGRRRESGVTSPKTKPPSKPPTVTGADGSRDLLPASRKG